MYDFFLLRFSLYLITKKFVHFTNGPLDFVLGSKQTNSVSKFNEVVEKVAEI